MKKVKTNLFKNKTILIMVVVILALAAGLVIVKGKKLPPSDQGQNGDQYNVNKVSPIDAADHVFGSLTAPIQMIVYSDFECPFCAGFSETMKQVEREFGDKVAIAFRHYPLAGHPEAAKAAEASECAAEQGKFWEMHDKLFADNIAGRLGAEQSKQDASDLGLDAAKFNQCLASGKFGDKVAEMMAKGKAVGVTGTPTSFINGNIYPGAYPFANFTGSDGRPEQGMKSIISELLK